MSLSTLQAELASAKTEYEAKELEIRNLFSEKKHSRTPPTNTSCSSRG